MKFCTTCGRQVADDALVCPYCGNNMAYGGQAAPGSPASFYGDNQHTDSTAALVCGILSFFIGGIILAIVAICLANANKRDNGGVMGGNARIGRICGIVNLCINAGVVAIVIVLYLVVLFGMFAAI